MAECAFKKWIIYIFVEGKGKGKGKGVNDY